MEWVTWLEVAKFYGWALTGPSQRFSQRPGFRHVQRSEATILLQRELKTKSNRPLSPGRPLEVVCRAGCSRRCWRYRDPR